MFRLHPTFSLFDLFSPLTDIPSSQVFSGPRFLGIVQSSDEKNLILRLETPGIKKEDISVEVEGDYLKISISADVEKHTGGKRTTERTVIYDKSIFLGKSSDTDSYVLDTKHISASYENGVLEVTLPKLTPPKPQGRKINILSKL